MTNPQHSSAIVKLYDDLILEGQLKFEYVCGILSDSYIKQLISHYSVAIRRPNGDKESLESFTKLSEQERLECNLVIDETIRSRILCRGRCVWLSDQSQTCLFHIAKSRTTGILQTDLARAISTNPRNLFHMLKSLRRHEIIVRLPVSVRGTFTYLLILKSQYELGEDLNSGEQATSTTAEQSNNNNMQQTFTSEELRIRIMNSLEQAKSAPSKTLFQNLSLPSHAVKLYRKVVLELAEGGFLELLPSSSESAGQRLLRFRKAYLPKAKRLAIPDAKEHADSTSIVKIAETFPKNMALLAPLDIQAVDLIRANGSCTSLQLQSSLGIGSKLAYRLVGRLTDGKVLKLTNSSGGPLIRKETEFYGKERRIRLYYNDENNIINEQISAATPIASEKPDSSPSVPFARDSVTRIHRQQIILEILADATMMEVGKKLAILVQKRLDSKDSRKSENAQTFILDVKTLKRTIAAMEGEGLVKTLTIVLPNGAARMVVLRPEVSVNDPKVEEYLSHLQQGTAAFTVANDSPAATDDVANDVIDSPSMYQENAHKFEASRHGFIYGVMLRVRALHEYLLSLPQFEADLTEDRSSVGFETLKTLFRQMPLSLFLSIVGLAEMSNFLHHGLQNPSLHVLPMSALPSPIQREILQRRGYRFRQVVRLLMGLLQDLGLVTSDESFPSVAFKIPFAYRLHLTARLPMEDDGKVYAFPNDFHQYWLALQMKTTENNVFEGLPNELSTALGDPHCWSATQPVSRWIQRRLRGIVRNCRSKREDFRPEVTRLANGYKIDTDTLLNMAQSMMDEIEDQAGPVKRHRRRQIAFTESIDRPPSVRRKRPPKESQTPTIERFDSDDQEERTFILEQPARVTPAQIDLMRLVFILLHEPELQSPRCTLQWHLSEGLSIEGNDNCECVQMPSDPRNSFVRWCLADLAGLDELDRLEQRVTFIKRLVPWSSLLAGEDGATVLKNRLKLLREWLKIPLQELVKQAYERNIDEKGQSFWTWFGRGKGETEYKRVRHGRYRQFELFNRLPYYSLPSSSDEVSYYAADNQLVRAACDIRLVMSIPADRYDPMEAALYLSSKHPDELVARATNWLAQLGVLTRSSSGRGRYRIPGTAYALGDRLGALLIEDGGGGSSSDPVHTSYRQACLYQKDPSHGDALFSLDDVIETRLGGGGHDFGISAEDIARGTFFETFGNCNILPATAQPPPLEALAARSLRILQTVQAHQPGNDQPAPLWRLLGKSSQDELPDLINRPLLYNVISLVDNAVRASPGLKLEALVHSQWPVLFEHEVRAAVDLLVEAGLLERLEVVKETTNILVHLQSIHS